MHDRQDHINEQSLQNAYALFESDDTNYVEVDTAKGLCYQIPRYLFNSFYDFSGHIRSRNISKGGFRFANGLYIGAYSLSLKKCQKSLSRKSSPNTWRLNIAYPFMERNGRVYPDIEKKVEVCGRLETGRQELVPASHGTRSLQRLEIHTTVKHKRPGHLRRYGTTFLLRRTQTSRWLRRSYFHLTNKSEHERNLHHPVTRL